MRPGVVTTCRQCWRVQPCPVHPKTRSPRNPDTAVRDRFYHSTLWLRLRSWWLAISPEEYPEWRCGPFCWGCKEKGFDTVLGNEVDHIVPIQDGGQKTAPSNLQTLCKSCHSEKTRQEQLARSKDAGPTT